MLKKRPCLLCLCGILVWLLPSFCVADEVATNVKQASLSRQGDYYVLSADIDYHLGTKAKDALQNGVPLFWTVQVKIQQVRRFLWDTTLVETALKYRLQYHALLNMYRVRNEGSGEIYSFSTLSAALDLMSAVRDFRVVEIARISPEKTYQCAIKVAFVRDALPLPLRPVAYIDAQWYLSSDWTLWPLRK